jgi:hypothetical protein
MADDIKNIVINDWGNLTASVRTRASGKERVTLEIRGDALLINTDEKELMKPIAAALAAEIRKGVQTFHGVASPATRKAREVAARAFANGEAWARKRYSGGQIGAMAPNQTPRLLNDSGRLAKSIVVGVTNAKEHVVNVAANRLGPESDVRRRTLDLLRPIVEAAMRSDAAAKGVEASGIGAVLKTERDTRRGPATRRCVARFQRRTKRRVMVVLTLRSE